jgi:hypothetical protein
LLFFADSDAVDIEGCTVDDGGGAAGGLDGRVEHWVHVLSVKKRERPPRILAP